MNTTKLRFLVRNILFRKGILIDEVRLNILVMFIVSRITYNQMNDITKQIHRRIA